MLRELMLITLTIHVEQ